jgi:hypothetical protein
MCSVLAAACTTIDVMFIVDNSGNINAPAASNAVSNFNRAIQFIQAAGFAMNVDCNNVRAGVVLFGNNGLLKVKLSDSCDPTTFSSNVQSKVLFQNQRANLAAGLATAAASFNVSMGGRNNSFKIAVVLYGGQASTTSNPSNGTIEAALLQSVADQVFVFNTDFFVVNNLNLATPVLAMQIASQPYSTHLFTLTAATGYDFNIFLTSYVTVLKNQITNDCNVKRQGIVPYSGSGELRQIK